MTEPTAWIACSGLAVVLSLAFLGLSLTPSVRPLLAEASISYALRSVVGSGSLATPVLVDLLRFMAACLLLHVCLGLIAVGLTKASEAAKATSDSQRLGVVFLWFTAMSVAVVLWSADTLPQSHSAAIYGRIAGYGVGSASLAQIWTAGVLLAACGVILVAVWRVRQQFSRPRPAVLVTGSLAIVALGVAVQGPTGARASVAEPVQPHVIIVGIDSLRPDTLTEMMSAGRLPNMSRLISRSAWFPDTITPLARTFPAWVSILTGRAPGDCAVVCNLVPREEVTLDSTLATALRDRGYRTVLATDEVRFSNIDESYGFDQLVTPSIGAAEFLIGRVSDQPLLNLLGGTPIVRWLFPEIYGNRAVAHVYRPETFVQRLETEIDVGGPMFMALHLTAPHWPYVVADSRIDHDKRNGPDSRYGNYVSMVEVADRQLGEVLGWLKEAGVLDNALVVLLSDHGEALGRPEDSLLEGVDEPEIDSIAVSTGGHGSSVLSAAQFQVFLGFAAFGAAADRVSAGLRPHPAVLEDVTPTLLEMLGVESFTEFDGMSLAGIVAGQDDGGRLSGRIRFTETGFNTPRLLAGDLNPDWIAVQAADHYTVNPDTGRLELRRSSIPLVNAMKERAAIKGDQLLAALPNVSGSHTYLLVDRSGGRARILDEGESDPEVTAMRLAMQARFGYLALKGDRPTSIEVR